MSLGLFDNFTETTAGNSPSPARMTALIVLILVAVIGLYMWLKRKTPYEALVTGPIELGSTKSKLDKWSSILDAEQTMKTSGNNVTCSFFLFVSDTVAENVPLNNDGTYALQYVVTIGNVVGIKMDSLHQRCVVDVLQTPPHGSQSMAMEAIKNKTARTLVAEPVHNQRWNQITVCIEGRSVDVFVNGRLQTSAQLDNLPAHSFTGLMINSSPDFRGQAALFQMWPERRSSQQILENYQRNTDIRGKPLVPYITLKWDNVWSRFKETVCKGTGFCGLSIATGPLEYVEYEFA